MQMVSEAKDEEILQTSESHGRCCTKVEEEQKKVIVAYGDGDKNGTLRGTAPRNCSKRCHSLAVWL